jgi:tetratricopeptide (TPR) repeat protein
MNGNSVKYLFSCLLGLLLIIMVLTSRDAGITCDEILHYKHSVSVYNYFASRGKDLSALDTPETHLKYYGQSYDNLVTIIIKLSGIEDIYGFRHIMSSLAGWLIVLLTAVFAVWLTGYRSGIMVVILFAISPGFMGHSWNNLKDIPFALAYIGGIYYIIKSILSEGRPAIRDLAGLTLSIAFCISIRPGGLILICYLFFFLILYRLFIFFKEGIKPHTATVIKEMSLYLILSALAVALSMILWPFALQNPFRNIIESYRVMEHFPSTFRQLFEGKNEWSDLMPWYYLIKSMAITIPLVVTAGILLFILFSRKVIYSGKAPVFAFLAFTLIFPVVFVIIKKSNLYSSWRQFLFLYPVIIILASAGYHFMAENIRSRALLIGLTGIMILTAIHPVRFMFRNLPYSYVYYNQLVGGLKGASGNYETDYYYVSQTEAAEWLIGYLEEKKNTGRIKVGASSPIGWSFRKQPWIETSYFRYEERSMCDWDYAVAVNRYIPPFRLKNGTWPPGNTIKIIYADSVPICAILERKSHNDYMGYTALNDGRVKDAVRYFSQTPDDVGDEMIFYNFARALYDDGQFLKADSLLRKALVLNPEFEPALMFLGNIAKKNGRKEEAVDYYRTLIRVNRKYFEAYVELAGLLAENDVLKARAILRDCLTLNPRYRPAISLLAGTYRQSDPDVAEKYYELLKSDN